jgi:hypothetical protein
MSLKYIAAKLNVCVGTIRRWQELRDVPPQYTFDLYRLLGKDIDYGLFSATMKDQFFTPPDIAQKCWATFLAETGAAPEDYTFIEPSAGDGSFMRVLPAGSICMDIEPRAAGIMRQDYLQWKPAGTGAGGRYIVFGNPPFGLRGHLALNFINHSYEFADYVCFILPQLFESDGKGSPRKRVIGYNLIYSEALSAPFYSPDAQKVKVNGVFQIWSTHRTSAKYQLATAGAAGTAAASKMKIYSLSDGGTVATTRNKAMIGRCDIYLPSTCFGRENMRVYDSFDALPGKKGYGVVFLEERERQIEKARTLDWAAASFLSTNSAYNLRTSLIVLNLVSEE